jgi:peptide/nickel transport system substrate-binding protein
MAPALFPNSSKPPFDDAKVRQAFSLAVDRESLIKVILGEGNAVPQYGPISPSVSGYWPGVEYIGYGYDLEKAKALMEEAGYVYNSDGMLEKDGEPFKLEISFSPGYMESIVKIAEILQQQYRALGVDVELGQYEWGVFIGMGISGEATLGLVGYNYWDADILAMFYRSGAGMNFSHYSDPNMDEILDQMRATVDREARQALAAEAQRYLVEQAVAVPLYTSKQFIALSNRVMGEIPLLPIDRFWLSDAYLITE